MRSINQDEQRLKEFTYQELSERRAFIIEQVRRICAAKNIVHYVDLAEKLEYVGITRTEVYNTIHYLERTGRLIWERRSRHK